MLMRKKKKPTPKPKPRPATPGETKLASDHPAGCTYLEVESSAGFEAGQTIEIDAGSPMAEIQTVTGLGSILLGAPLLYPHPQGAPVQKLANPSVPIQEPVQTTSAGIPSYNMVQPAPMTTAYATPSYTQAPVYAAPATTAYAAPAYASPAYASPAYASPAYTTSTPLMGGTTAYPLGGAV
jgi:hypothetical protein